MRPEGVRGMAEMHRSIASRVPALVNCRATSQPTAKGMAMSARAQEVSSQRCRLTAQAPPPSDLAQPRRNLRRGVNVESRHLFRVTFRHVGAATDFDS